MDNPVDHDPRAELASALSDLETLNAAAAQADADLRAAADNPKQHGALPDLRVTRARARRAVDEAAAKLPALRAAAEREDAIERAEADRVRHAAEAEARAGAAEQERRLREEELAPLLVALEDASTKARDASAAATAAEACRAPLDAADLVAFVLGGHGKALAIAHSRAELAAESLAAAASTVAAKDERHPATRAASAHARAAGVHGILADADELRVIADGARALNLAMLDRLDAILAARGPASVEIILAALIRDASAAPLPIVAHGRHVAVWTGLGATEQEALACAARATENAASLPPDVLGRLVLDGRGHEAAAVATERERTTELAARTTEFSRLVALAMSSVHPTPRGGLAAKALEVGRELGRFVDEPALEQHLEQMVDEGIGHLTAERLSDIHHGRYSTSGPGSREPTFVRWPHGPTREAQIAAVLGVPVARVPSLEAVAA